MFQVRLAQGISPGVKRKASKFALNNPTANVIPRVNVQKCFHLSHRPTKSKLIISTVRVSLNYPLARTEIGIIIYLALVNNHNFPLTLD